MRSRSSTLLGRPVSGPCSSWCRRRASARSRWSICSRSSQVRLSDGAIVGHEALLRWQHPERGVLAPAQFLQVAEDNGLLDAIDWRTYRRACEALAHLPGGGFVSVNVPSRLLRHADFEARLLKLVEESGLGPGQLRIEISEGTLLHDPDTVAGILGRLRDGGVDTVLD